MSLTVILTKVRIIPYCYPNVLNRHSDESQNHLKKILNQVQDDDLVTIS